MMRIRSPSSSRGICSTWGQIQQQRLAVQILHGGRSRSASSSSSSSSHSSSNSSKGRSYLERWAGIRGGTGASGSRTALEAPSPSGSTSAAPVSFFGRTYLLSTVKLPPFPTAPPSPPPIGGSTATGCTTNGSAKTGGQGGREKDDVEEERVFKWMRAALNGPGALGTSGLFPGKGSPVVLDLGAVSQDGSPHGRPAGRASLTGAARAVRAAGLLPVGVCNTSHDVLALASEQGLPEIMMVQARPRSSRQSSAPVTESTLRKPASLTSRRPSPSTGRSSAAAPAAAVSPETHPAQQHQQQHSTQSPAAILGSKEAPAPAPAPAPAAAAVEAAVAVTPSAPAPAGSSQGCSSSATDAAADALVEDRDSGDGGALGGKGEQGGDRETLVYQGSVRSGQQVFAEGTSLVVLGAVSSGGEVMADGDIHVYGTLRGRALAGLSGNKSAKIFATRFDAELVGVGDTFTTCDDPANLAGLVVDTPTNVCLRDDKLVFRSFDLSSTNVS